VLLIFVLSAVANPIFAKLNIPIYWPALILIGIVQIINADLILKRASAVSIFFLFLLLSYEYSDLYSDNFFLLGAFSIFIPFYVVGFLQNFVVKWKKDNLSIFIGEVTLYSVGLVSALTLYELGKNPLVIREIFISKNQSLTHSFVAIYFLPFVVSALVYKKIKKLSYVLFIGAILNVLVILTCGLSTVLLIFFLMLVGALVIRFDIKVRSYKFFVILISALLLIGFLPQILDLASNIQPTEIGEMKKEEISNIDYSSFDSFLRSYRLGVYYESYSNFISNPVFGDKKAVIGSHSSILDKLSLFGLVGTFLFLLSYALLFRNFQLDYKDNKAVRFLRYSMIVLFISMLLNPLDIYYMQFYTLFFFLFPCVLHYLLRNNMKLT